MRRVSLVGAGRAGQSVLDALSATNTWETATIYRRGDDISQAAQPDSTGKPVDLLVIAVTDRDVAKVAEAIEIGPEGDNSPVVVHLAGSLGVEPVRHHRRFGVLHPLISLPDPAVGAARLQSGAWFGIATDGDPLVTEIVVGWNGHPVPISDDAWTSYHAAAAIASNHLVGLLGQVQRVAAASGVPLEAYLQLAEGTLQNVAAMGPHAALTGPVRRGDIETIAAHLGELDDDERHAYMTGVSLCQRLLSSSTNLLERDPEPTLFEDTESAPTNIEPASGDLE